MKKISLLVINVILLCSCSNNRLNDLETHINLLLSEQKSDTEFTLVLDTISSFEWDELLVAGPYTYLDDISGYNLNKIPNTISYHDRFTLFGFLNKKKGVKYVELNGSKKFEDIFDGDRVNYIIYKKVDTRFILYK